MNIDFNIDEVLSEMTLEEKASLLSGLDLWRTKPIERLGIPSIKVSDGPHGMRTQDEKGDNLGINDSREAVCFPPACLSACSFDRHLLKEEGEAIGSEASAFNVAVVLGPGVNIKRSPLCGRNFEYFSEDPCLAGEMGAALIEGIQSETAGASVKHFACNNQETDRMSYSAEVDERTLAEIYLLPFEKIVKKAHPRTVMSSYNRINGVFSSDNKRLLTDVLRDKWGFDGLVMSDWSGTDDRVLGVKAGLDLEMPSSNGVNDREIVKAVKRGELAIEDVDRSVRRVLNLVKEYYKIHENHEIDLDRDHDISEKVAENSIILLKNDDNILPLSKQEKILFCGEFFENPRYQGGGSSHINSHSVTIPIKVCEEKKLNFEYRKCFSSNDDKLENKSFEEALKMASSFDRIVIFAGLPESFESEGYDRKHMRLPESQNEVIKSLAEKNPNIVIVLQNGSPIEMPWKASVKGIVESYLAGEGGGEAVIRILLGEVNPSGKLAETFPLRLEDNPSYLTFGRKGKIPYNEGIFVGYRYYDKKKMEVLFPFGHGLSYTEFKYMNMRLEKKRIKDNDKIKISADIKNIGSVSGKEVVELYISDDNDAVLRPEKELKDFCKIELEPEETKTVEFLLDKRSFAYFNSDIMDWAVTTGKYRVMLGSSSRDIRLEQDIEIESTDKLPFTVGMDTTIGELKEHPEIKDLANDFYEAIESVYGKDDPDREMDIMKAMINTSPIRNVYMFNWMSKEDVEKRIAEINKITSDPYRK